MFKKKDKRSKEEIEKERAAKNAEEINKLKLMVISLNKKKSFYFSKLCEAKEKGLEAPEKSARSNLKRTMAYLKQCESMLMSLEMAIESRDLTCLQLSFLEIVGDISKEILSSSSEFSDKHIGKMTNMYEKAMFQSSENIKSVDNLIAGGDYAAAAAFDNASFAAFDDEIDSMLNDTELVNSVSSTAANKFKV